MVLAAVLVAHRAAAQEAPRLVSSPSVVYPKQALRNRVEGDVLLELSIDASGHVTEARVTQGLGHGLDDAALSAAKQYVFAPATDHGVAIASTLDLTIPFRLPPAPKPPPAPKEVTQTGPGQNTLVVAERRVPTASLHEPDHVAASDAETTHDELMLVPRSRAENVLEDVPGLFTLQQAGGGKAQSYYMRGFDLDHGTDLAFFIDGVPINAVSHAHGQGYSDLHFIIPETIGTLESTKGPYSARVGDFATAGSVAFHMLDHVEDSFAKIEVGPYSHWRGVALASPDLGKDWRMLAAVEAFNEDGPFIHPESFGRFDGYLKVSHRLDERSSLSMLVTGYGGSWNMSGVLPARAVCGEGDGTPVPAAYSGPNCLSRWDSADPTQGGAAQRVMGTATYTRLMERGDLEASAYVVHSNLQVFPNDGVAASFQPGGVQYGSQIEQDDERTEFGLNARLSKVLKVDRFDVRATAGLQFRDDVISSQLHRTEGRARLDGAAGIPGPITDSGINESEVGAYAEADWHVSKRLRFVVGARADRVDVAVSNESPVAVLPISGYQGAMQLSPKGSMIASPLEWLELFANFGRGFHTNDARTVVAGSSATLIATATGGELGAAVHPLAKRLGNLSVSAVAFLLDLSSELTIDGDTASTSPSGATQRVGGEFTVHYDYRREVFLDATLTVAHARYTDAADVAAGTDSGPLAPIMTFGAIAGVRHKFGPITAFGSVEVRAMSDRPATQDNSLTATGFVMVDASLGARWKHVELGAQLFNVGDVTWREGQFAVASRLPLEGPSPPVGISFTPGIPRTLLGHLALYW